MAQAKPAATQRAAPQQQDAASDILGVIAGTLSRGAGGTVGAVTAQAVVDALTAAGYVIS